MRRGLLFLILLQQAPIDEDLPRFKPSPNLKGNLTSVGSDTLANLMTFWAEALTKHHPDLKVEMQSKGSSTAAPALISKMAQLGPMSRPMKPTELQNFAGPPPVALTVAFDALAIYVNGENPIEEITLEQVDAIWGKTRRRGGKAIKVWGDLGLKGEWADKPIAPYSRNAASGTYGFFKERVLLTGDFKDEVKEQPSGSVVLAVAVDRFGIGYSGVGYATSSVKALRIASKAGETAVAPSAAAARDGTYPLSRVLLIYIRGEQVDPKAREFLFLALSREGQEIVVKDGFFPLSTAQVQAELKKLD